MRKIQQCFCTFSQVEVNLTTPSALLHSKMTRAIDGSTSGLGTVPGFGATVHRFISPHYSDSVEPR